jgi:hypothetical protein
MDFGDVMKGCLHLRTFEIVAEWEYLSSYASNFLEKVISARHSSAFTLIFQSDLALKEVMEL